jgi:hypothetical protein
MRKRCFTSLFLVLFLSTWAYAQNEQYRLSLDFGNRWKAGFSGNEDLYRSQLDLGEGPKLFSGVFSIFAPNNSNRFFDRLELRMNSWGGEPYNTARVRAVKAGIYELRFDYQNVAYFNSVPFFANPLFEQGNLESQHQFDISQRFARVELTLRPGKRVSPFVAYQRTSRQGPALTTLRTDGNEFLTRLDVDTHSDDLNFGVNFTASQFSLRLEQGFRWYRDTSPFLAPGFQEGNSSRPVFGRDIVLNNYAGQNDVEGTIPFSTAVGVYHPFDSLLLRGKVSYSMGDVNSNFSDAIDGTFFSFPLQAFYQGQEKQALGRAKRPNLFGDFSVTWQPFKRFRILESLNIRRSHVSGSAQIENAFLNVDPLFQPGIIPRLETSSLLDTFLSRNLTIQELQGVFYLSPRFSVRAGHRFEHKEVGLSEDFAYDRNVLILGTAYEFSARSTIALEYELGRTDQPIFRTDVVDFDRLRLRGRFHPFDSLQLSGSVTLFDNNNDIPEIDLTSRQRSYTLQFTYTPVARISISGAYERSELDSDLLFIIPQSFQPDRSIYAERSDYANLFVSLLLLRNARLDVGYSGSGTVGNFPMNYHQPMARLEIPLGERFIAYGQWNYHDYKEKVSLLPQSYQTHLVVLGFRVELDSQ